METRKITIANSRDQKKSVIMTAATTLGELKRDMDEAGIAYGDMDFIEALTKTQLRGNDSVLPHDVPYNHTVTNELVFLLTVPNRKIKSGVSRGEIYERINDYADSDALKSAIKGRFGRNYTMVSTNELAGFVEEWQHFHKDPVDHEKGVVGKPIADVVRELEEKVDNLHEAMLNVIHVLDIDYITDDIQAALDGALKKDRTVYSAGMSADDIDELVNSID